MIVPGSNLLNLALSVQGKQTVQWLRATDRAPNSVGQLVTTYADPVPIHGSFQPKNQAWAQSHGLDLAKDYALFYASDDMTAVKRGESGDRFTYGGATFQAASDEADWFQQDGWKAMLLVRIGPPNA